MSEQDDPKYSDEFYTALGWMLGECCAALDRGDDPRQMEVSEMMKRAEKDCAPDKGCLSDKGNSTLRACPSCHYETTQLAVKAVRVSVSCPRCGKRTLDDFVPLRSLGGNIAQ